MYRTRVALPLPFAVVVAVRVLVDVAVPSGGIRFCHVSEHLNSYLLQTVHGPSAGSALAPTDTPTLTAPPIPPFPVYRVRVTCAFSAPNSTQHHGTRTGVRANECRTISSKEPKSERASSFLPSCAACLLFDSVGVVLRMTGLS